MRIPAVREPDRAIPAKVTRYCRRLVGRYDTDGDGELTEQEWGRMRGDPRRADFNLDGQINGEELAKHVADYGRQRRISLARHSWGNIAELPPLLQPSTPRDGPSAAVRRPTDESQADGAADTQRAAAETQSSAPPTRRDRRFAARLPKGLPDWFVQRDADGDGQLTTDEFAPEGTKSQHDQFAAYDANSDGVVTAKEYLRAAK